MDILSVGLQGMNQAQEQLEQSAEKIARSGGEAVSSNGQYNDTVDISEAMISMLSAKTAFESNAKSIEVAQEVSKTVIDIIA
jgi:DNA-binding ferritin-like protein